MKAMLSELLARIYELMDLYKDDMFSFEELSDLRRRAENKEASSIAVVGQFSVGKSALLNALLGEPLLAERRIETTKVTTRIRRSDQQQSSKVILHDKEGGSRELPLGHYHELNQFTTFQGAMNDDVTMVDVYWPVTFMNNEVMLIDTPGTNSITKEAFITTERQLRNASAVLFLFNGRKGLDRTDYGLLSELHLSQKQLFLVATHMDGLLPSERQLMLEGTMKQLEEMHMDRRDPRIFSVSSKQALEAKQTSNSALLDQSGIKELEHALTIYTAERQYEAANVQAISHDLNQLEQQLTWFRQQEERGAQVQKRDRQLRVERLILLTKQNYNNVLGLGREQLVLREPKVSSTLKDKKREIDDTLKKRKTELYQSFRGFKDHVSTLNQLKMTSVSKLKNEYIQHMKGISGIYEEVLNDFYVHMEKLCRSLETLIQEEDRRFVDALEEESAATKLDWPAFRSRLQGQSNVQTRSIDYDQELFADYERDRKEYAESLRRNLRNQETLKSKQATLTREEHEKLLWLDNDLEEEIRKLGPKPDPAPMTEKKGFWFWKKDVTTGYDYSKQQRWEENMANRFREYEHEKQQLRTEIRNKRDELIKQGHWLQEQQEKLEQTELELESELFTELMKSLESMRDQAQQSYTQMEREVYELWTIQERHLLACNREHTEHLQQLFSTFIQEQLELSLSNITLSNYRENGYGTTSDME